MIWSKARALPARVSRMRSTSGQATSAELGKGLSACGAGERVIWGTQFLTRGRWLPHGWTRATVTTASSLKGGHGRGRECASVLVAGLRVVHADEIGRAHV